MRRLEVRGAQYRNAEDAHYIQPPGNFCHMEINVLLVAQACKKFCFAFTLLSTFHSILEHLIFADIVHHAGHLLHVIRRDQTQYTLLLH
jgi:hypothetical protein